MSKQERIDPSESRMFEQIKELCCLCARGIVKIANDNNYPPQMVAKFFIEIFNKIVSDLEK